MPTREQFQREFQGRFLLFLTDAWNARHQRPSELGMVMDRHAVQLRELLGDVFNFFQPDAPKPAANGAAQPKEVKR